MKTLLLCAALASTCCAADIQMWVDDAGGNIGEVDVNTGKVTLIGGTGRALTDIAFAPNGTLYGIDYQNLYTINTQTATATYVGPLSGASGTTNSLVFGQNGTLYMATDNLYTLNPSTGAATEVGSIGYTSGGDLAFVNGTLYLATASDQLVKVNTQTGAGTLVGNLGVPEMYGLATPGNGVLYGVASTSVYYINTDTGAATLDVSYAGQGLGQAGGESFITEALPPGTTATAPEPYTWTLAATGLLLLAGASFCRRLRSCYRGLPISQ